MSAATDAEMALWRSRGYAVAWIAERFGVSAAEVARALARDARRRSAKRG